MEVFNSLDNINPEFMWPYFSFNCLGGRGGGGVVLGWCTSPSGKLFFITQEPLGLCYTHERPSAQNLVVNIFKKNT